MPFNKDAFMSLIEGDRDLASELLQLFADDWPEVFGKLEQAVKESKHSDVEKLAHRIKGNLRNFFADETALIAAAVEDAGRNQKLAGVEEKLVQLKAELQALQGELEEFNSTL